MQVIVFMAFLAFTYLFMKKNRDNVDKQEFKERFGAFMTNIETYKKPRSAFYPFIFLLRRLSIAVAIVFLRDYIVFSVLIIAHISLGMICWLADERPYDARYKNNLEIANEFLVLILSYFGFLFTDYVPSPVLRYKFGYFYIALLALGLLLNLSTMVSFSILNWIRLRQVKKNRLIVQHQQQA